MEIVDAAYFYRQNSVACLSVSLSWPWALQRRLNRSWCRMEFGLWRFEPHVRRSLVDPHTGSGNFESEKGLAPDMSDRWSWYTRSNSAERSTGTVVRRVGAIWRIRLSRPCMAAMRPYIKLLWSHILVACVGCSDGKKATSSGLQRRTSLGSHLTDRFTVDSASSL